MTPEPGHPDLLRDGLAWLEQKRTAHMTSPVEYRRPGEAGQPPVTLQATFGRTEYDLVDDFGATIRAHVIDFLILADDLGTEPEAGDVIAADGRRHEVMNLSGQGPWRWSDPYRTTFRIHTRDIGSDE